MIRTAFIFLLLSLLSAVVDADCRRDLEGDWVGWAYFDNGSDSPLRIRVEAGGDSISIRFDELVAARYDLPAGLVCDQAGIVITRKRPAGQMIRLHGRAQNGKITGEIDWVGDKGRFELIRASLRISRIPPEILKDVQGYYRVDALRSINISSRFWGEILYNDYGTGRAGTLFPLDTDRFFVGSASYVPSPVEAYVQFTRDTDRKITGLYWEDAKSNKKIVASAIHFSEEELAFQSGNTTLYGTLIRPVAGKKLPAVVVLGGSDWHVRDDTRRDATILASFGIATFVFDQRGYGKSQGNKIVSFRQIAEDALAALRALKTRTDLLPTQLGMTGRSRSGWIAPLAASMSSDVSFLPLFVPPAVSPATQETTRRLNLLQDAKWPEHKIQLARRLLDLTWHYAETGEGWEAYLEERKKAVEAELPEDIMESDQQSSEDWQWVRLNMMYDPMPALEKVKCPLLALFGESDRNVVPNQNVPLFRKSLQQAGNRDFQLIVIPKANHGLKSVKPSPATPLHRITGIGNEGWPTVAKWLEERLNLWGE